MVFLFVQLGKNVLKLATLHMNSTRFFAAGKLEVRLLFILNLDARGQCNPPV